MAHLSYLAYLVGWSLVRALPERIAYSLFNRIALVAYNRDGRGVQRLRKNLGRVKPDLSASELEELTLEAMSSYLRYWCDTFRIQDWGTERVLRTVTTTNEELLTGPMAENRGVVVALPHSGNWDHAGAFFCARGIPLVTVAERLKPEKLFQKFLHHREAMGFEVLSLDAKSFVTLIKRARERRLIALVADRDLSESGIEVTFFGGRAKMPAGPAVIAMKTGLPLVVAHVTYTPGGIHIDFHQVSISKNSDEKLAVSETVQEIARLFEIGIKENPVDWHMLQRIWIDDAK
mgnify:CR=1 FL=1